MLETLNWLTITTPFIAGYAAFSWGEQIGEGKLVPALVGTLAFLGLIAIWFVLYQLIAFPWWMAHFN